jgi:hypothetical protein
LNVRLLLKQPRKSRAHVEEVRRPGTYRLTRTGLALTECDEPDQGIKITSCVRFKIGCNLKSSDQRDMGTVMTAIRLLLVLVLSFISSFALGERFKGLLIPSEYGDPIPIVVELTRSGQGISGNVTTSFPHAGGGPISRSRRLGDICDVKSTINSEVSIALHGTCTSSAFKGNYTMYFRDQTERRGIFRLTEVESEKENATAKSITEGDARRLAATTPTMCLKANTTCLTGCPRDEYNAQFLCTMRCKHKFASCKAEGKKLRQAGARPFEEPDLGTAIP